MNLRNAAVVLAVLLAFWMTFDGTRALIVGDYVAPRSGPHAGELGPWARVVGSIGIEPRSTLMKSIFICFGLAWLGAAIWRVAGYRGSNTAILFLAACTLWYLPVGTLISLLLAGLTLFSIFSNRPVD